MTEESAWRSAPGKLLDIFLWRREYDDELHGIKRVSEMGED
ncbi:MAG: hypothetical protein ACOX7B_03285 [Christensenellales bacterium]